MIRILKHFIFTFIVTAIAFAFGCRASDPIPQRISAPIVSVEDIMNDTKAGTQSYEGKIVKVNGTVDYRDQNLLSLETGSSVSTFFINHDKSLNSFYRFNVGENYDFTLYVMEQLNGILTSGVRTHAASTEIKQVTIETLAAEVRSNSESYVGYPIRLTAKIETLKHSSINLDTSELNGEDTFSVYFYSDDHTYIEGRTYTFLLFVADMEKYESFFPNIIYLYPLNP